MNSLIKKPLMLVPLVFPVWLALLGGCGAGSGEGLDENGNPINGNTGGANTDGGEIDDEPIPGVSLETLVNEIFNNNALGSQRCTNCHAGASPLGGLNLQTPALAYANLVGANNEGVTANGNANFKRVLPGEPEESYLILKLEGDARAGSQMPLNETPLSEAQIAMVRDWIANGAAENGTGVQPTRISKLELPEQGQLNLRFSRELEPEQNIQDLIEIRFIEQDASWLALREHYDIEVGGQSLEINFNFPPSSIEGYVLRFNTSQLGGLFDYEGRIIDGNNNNNEGGEFYYEYRF